MSGADSETGRTSAGTLAPVDSGVLCVEHGAPIPAHVLAGHSPLTGTYRAVCDLCGVVVVGWECACEWWHDCGKVHRCGVRP